MVLSFIICLAVFLKYFSLMGLSFIICLAVFFIFFFDGFVIYYLLHCWCVDGNNNEARARMGTRFDSTFAHGNSNSEIRSTFY